MNLEEATVKALIEADSSISIANQELKQVTSPEELCNLVDDYFYNRKNVGYPIYLTSKSGWCLCDGTVIDENNVRFLLSDGVSNRIVNYKNAYKYYKFSTVCR